MPSEILAIGSDVASSADQTIASGDSVTFALGLFDAMTGS